MNTEIQKAVKAISSVASASKKPRQPRKSGEPCCGWPRSSRISLSNSKDFVEGRRPLEISKLLVEEIEPQILTYGYQALPGPLTPETENQHG